MTEPSMATEMHRNMDILQKVDKSREKDARKRLLVG